MAEPSERLPENAPGPFYVTEECIDCGLCKEILEEVFFEEGGRHFVGRQPESQKELELAREAMESCPTEAIGEE